MNAGGSVAGGFSTDVFRRMTKDRFTSIARSDLAQIIHQAIANDVETLFGDTIETLSEAGNSIDVTLASGTTRRFDLLVGADGLHSAVRRLVWGEESRFVRPLDCHVAAFEIAGYTRRDENVYLTHAEPGLSVSRFSLRDDRTLFMFVFDAAFAEGTLPDDRAGRIALLRSIFRGCRWEAPAALAALDDADEIYLDTVAQIEVPQWSKGRVVLVGDALACPSLLAGEGTGLAMAEAYVLAGELARARNDVEPALAAYEARLKDFVRNKQAAARKFAPGFFPKTRLAILARRIATRLLTVPPIADRLVGSSVRDDITLPDYDL